MNTDRIPVPGTARAPGWVAPAERHPSWSRWPTLSPHMSPRSDTMESRAHSAPRAVMLAPNKFNAVVCHVFATGGFWWNPLPSVGIHVGQGVDLPDRQWLNCLFRVAASGRRNSSAGQYDSRPPTAFHGISGAYAPRLIEGCASALLIPWSGLAAVSRGLFAPHGLRMECDRSKSALQSAGYPLCCWPSGVSSASHDRIKAGTAANRPLARFHTHAPHRKTRMRPRDILSARCCAALITNLDSASRRVRTLPPAGKSRGDEPMN